MDTIGNCFWCGLYKRLNRFNLCRICMSLCNKYHCSFRTEQEQLEIVDLFPSNLNRFDNRIPRKIQHINKKIPDKQKEANKRLIKTYNITLAEKQRLWEKQNKKCGICQKELKELSKANTDHDHKTGKIRELLCASCNRLLGFAHESIAILISACAYLERHRPGSGEKDHD